MATMSHHPVVETAVTKSCSSSSEESVIQASFSQIGQALESRTISLLDIVDAAEKFLTSKDDNERLRASRLLSHCIEHVPANTITKEGVSFLIQFYASRLHDFFSAAPLLEGLICLMTRFASHLQLADAMYIFSQMLAEIEPRTMPQAQRMLVFRILHLIVEQYSEAAVALNDDFVAGFISCLEGERDPRCLLTAFTVAEHIGKLLFKVGSSHCSLAEDLFDILACYFPISFKPPKSGSNAISPDELRVALRSAMCSSVLFCPTAVPFMIEKLTSVRDNSVADVADCLAAMLCSYGSSALSPFLTDLCTSLRDAYLVASSDPHVLASLLRAVRQVVLSMPEHAPSVFLTWSSRALLAPKTVRDEDPILLERCLKLLATMLSCSLSVADAVVREVIMALCDNYHRDKDYSLLVLNSLLSAFRFLQLQEANLPFWLPMEKGKAMVLSVYLDGLFGSLSAPSLKRLALEGLLCMCAWGNYLSDTDHFRRVLDMSIGCFEGRLSELWPDVESRQEISIVQQEQKDYLSRLMSHLCQVARAHANLFTDSIIPDICRFASASENDQQVATALNCLKELSDCSPTFAELTQRTLLTTCVAHPSISNFILDMVTRKVLVDSPQHHFRCFVRLCATCLSLADGPQLASLVHLAASFASCYASIKEGCNVVEDFAIRLGDSLLHGTVDGLATFIQEHLDLTSCSDLLRIDNINCLPVFAATLAAIPCEWSLGMNRCAASFVSFISVGQSTAPPTRWTVACLAIILNKLGHDEVSQLLDSESLKLTVASLPHELFGQVLRALVMRSHVFAYSFMVPNLVARMSACSTAGSSDLHPEKCVSTVLLDESHALLTECFSAHVSTLYRQRFFVTLLPFVSGGIATSLESSDTSLSNNPWVAVLGTLCSTVPFGVLRQELQTFFPLLTQFLRSQVNGMSVTRHSCSDDVESVLKICAKCVSESSSFMADHLGMLVPVLLQLLSNSSSDAIQIAVLDALSAVAKLPFVNVYPWQQTVLRNTGKMLDARTRSCRKAASYCRNVWYMISE
jgi:DNA repair/transcription protein MET18/MMS19